MFPQNKKSRSAENDHFYCPQRLRKAAATGQGLPQPSRAYESVSVLKGLLYFISPLLLKNKQFSRFFIAFGGNVDIKVIMIFMLS